MKYTKQKEAILNQVRKMHNHPTADEIYYALKKNDASVSLATVYRNLSTFAKSGEIVRVAGCGGADRFDWRLDKHQHFVCDQCGMVHDVELDVQINLSQIPWLITGYNIMVHGLCNKCKPSNH